MMDVNEITTTAPGVLFHSTFTPIIGVLIFDGKWGPAHIITILVICMLLAAMLEFIRGFNTQKVFSGPEVAYRGMAMRCRRVVMLLVAAGRLRAGSEHYRLYQASSPSPRRWPASIILMLVLVSADHAGGNDHRFQATRRSMPSLEMIPNWHILPVLTHLPSFPCCRRLTSVVPFRRYPVSCHGRRDGKISPFERGKTHVGPVLVGLIIGLSPNRKCWPWRSLSNDDIKSACGRFLCFNNFQKSIALTHQGNHMFRKDIVIPSGAMALALCVFSAQADPPKATQYGDF